MGELKKQDVIYFSGMVESSKIRQDEKIKEVKKHAWN